MGRYATAAVVALLLTSACGSGESGDDSPDAGDVDQPDAGPIVDLTEAMFDPDRVLDIEIELDPNDWDELRTQARSILDVLGSSCLTAPPPSPFTYFPATVRIDGEEIANVGVRKKGFFGSLSEVKPSLKLKFTEYDPAQRFSGMKRMTLNNAISDQSYVKQCIGYDLFAKAGVPAPRCNFARVRVNGQQMGVYVHVEAIKKQFIARHFDDNDGNLYEGALSDFRPGWVETFQKKTNDVDPDRSDIEALVPIMELPDAQFLAALEQQVNVDEFIDMWAAELLMMHADGYARNTNNFYIYDDPVSGKWSFLPWGIDSIMFNDVTLPWEDARPPVTAWAEGTLARRLYNIPETRQRYFDRLQELLATVWDESALLAEVDRMEALVDPYVVADELNAFRAAADTVRNFVENRRDVLEAELSTEPTWGTTLRDPWCIASIGTATGSFTTTFGTLDDPDPLNQGTATQAVIVNGIPYDITQSGAVAGWDADSGRPSIRLLSLISPTELLIVLITIDESQFRPGVSLPIDWLDVSGYVVTIDFAVMPAPLFTVVGIIGDGSLDLTAASTTDGMTVSGTLSAVVYEPIF